MREVLNKEERDALYKTLLEECGKVSLTPRQAREYCGLVYLFRSYVPDGIINIQTESFQAPSGPDRIESWHSAFYDKVKRLGELYQYFYLAVECDPVTFLSLSQRWNTDQIEEHVRIFRGKPKEDAHARRKRQKKGKSQPGAGGPPPARNAKGRKGTAGGEGPGDLRDESEPKRSDS